MATSGAKQVLAVRAEWAPLAPVSVGMRVWPGATVAGDVGHVALVHVPGLGIGVPVGVDLVVPGLVVGLQVVIGVVAFVEGVGAGVEASPPLCQV